MRIFVTGASGFLGRNFLKVMLEKTNHEFYLLARSEESEENLKRFFIRERERERERKDTVCQGRCNIRRFWIKCRRP